MQAQMSNQPVAFRLTHFGNPIVHEGQNGLSPYACYLHALRISGHNGASEVGTLVADANQRVQKRAQFLMDHELMDCGKHIKGITSLPALITNQTGYGSKAVEGLPKVRQEFVWPLRRSEPKKSLGGPIIFLYSATLEERTEETAPTRIVFLN